MHVCGYLDLHRHLEVQQVNNFTDSAAVLDPSLPKVVPILDAVEVTIRKSRLAKDVPARRERVVTAVENTLRLRLDEAQLVAITLQHLVRRGGQKDALG